MRLPRPIESYIQAYNDMDVAGMLACLSDDVVFQNIVSGETNVQADNKREFEDLTKMGVSVFRERNQSVTECIVVGEGVMIRVHYKAVVAADLPNGWRTGQKLDFVGTSYFELKNGQIAKIVDAVE